MFTLQDVAAMETCRRQTEQVALVAVHRPNRLEKGCSGSLHPELYKQLMDFLRRPQAIGAEQSPAAIHARSSTMIGFTVQSDNAQTAHAQLFLVPRTARLQDSKSTSHNPTAHASKVLWRAWHATPRTCKSKNVPGTMKSTAAAVQLASACTAPSTCTPKAARWKQAILCFVADGVFNWQCSLCPCCNGTCRMQTG
ncbi:unnamed protein product [Symbiodinium sp. CCMP2592]|nr:unnamed protein product [Symbiodinium sp. CCMP2592]